MELLKLLKKYGHSVSFNKTDLYKEIESKKQLIKSVGFSYSLKSAVDLFHLEIVATGINNMQFFDDCYDKFLSKNFDVLEYINYDEQKMMFNHDLESTITNATCFSDKQSQTIIYVPFLEAVINHRFVDDYQILKLKQHQEYIANSEKSVDIIFNLYGIQPYLSDFSSLQIIGSDNTNFYFYHPQFKVVYIFDQVTFELVNEFYLVDKHSKIDPTNEQIKELVILFINHNDVKVIEYMLENQFISEKISKKIIKKLVKK